MDWNTKIEMVKALNKGNYEQAVSIFSKDKDWDYQTIDMFINGFNLSECTERQADYLDIYIMKKNKQ